MKKTLTVLLLLLGLGAAAQTFNNEWIDYNKTYYKFKVGRDGVYRISGAALATAGLGSANVQHFQLWRNGVEVPIFTSVTAGTLGATDFIEFWGKMNDGKPDRELYRDPSFHLNERWSLISDSASYFLTINTAGSNKRLETTPNNVAGNTLPAEPYFMYTYGQYYKAKVNPGLFYVVGSDHLFSSSYDRGEGYTSFDIQRNGTLTENIVSLHPATTGPTPTFKINLSGNAYNSRNYLVTINGDSITGDILPYMNLAKAQTSFNLSSLGTGNAAVAISNLTEDCGTSNCPVDRMVVHQFEITYPRQFNFGGNSNFEFTLPANGSGNYLEISNVAHAGANPVIYDLTNGKRYEGQIAGSVVKFVLLPSSVARNLVLVSQAPGHAMNVDQLQTRNFVDYNNANNRGDYIIITHPSLFNGAAGSNPVEDYRAYRSSATGGAFNAKIYLEDQLIDQFGFGIKKNPAGIRNFVRFIRNKYPVQPKHIFIIGRGVNYLHQKANEAQSSQIKENLEKLNLVPTYGWPASDVLLVSDPGTSSPKVPIGRLTAIYPSEVADYLKKVKDLERAQQTPSPIVKDKSWMKNIAHIIGAGDGILSDILYQYMENYRLKAEDTLYGAKVSTFIKTTTNNVQQLNEGDLTRLFNEGLSLLTYYGHSSATVLEFNLDEPANYLNQGKYPMFLALGCNAGNTFDYQENRFTQRNYLSDKWVFAPERGSINFVASSHFGIVHYLDIWNSRAYTNLTSHQYRRSIGEVMKKTIEDVYGFTTTDDFFARCNAEETILNGDPAVIFNQQPKPDYVVTDSLIKIAPSISVADQSFKVEVKLLNIGRAINRPIVVETKRQFPDQAIEVVRRDTIRGIRYADSLSFRLPIDPIRDKGTNRIYVTVDVDGAVDEMFETNNSNFREMVIFEDEARPVFPANMAIINSPTATLKVSTANPFSSARQYRVEIDTSETFNSPSKVVVVKSAAGGLIEFDPGFSYKDSTVYYWRVAPVPTTGNFVWNNASFVYLSNHDVGFNQSHYYQHMKSGMEQLDYQQGNKWSYKDSKNNLLIKSGVFPTGASQAAELSVAVNGANFIRSVCGLPNIIVNVFDPYTFQPWLNAYSGPGQYGSDNICGGERAWNFQYNLNDSNKRRKLVEFLEMIPSGHIVVIRNTSGVSPTNNYYTHQWKSDTSYLGSGRSIYHHLFNQGFANADSFDRPRAFIFTYQKDRQAQVPSKSIFSDGIYDKITLSADYFTPDTLGYVTSPVFGPAKNWKEFRWRGTSVDQTPGDNARANIIGIKFSGAVDTLMRGISSDQRVTSIASIDASIYPFLQLHMQNKDSIHHTPYTLNYWRVTYDPLPEGVVSPNIFFQMKDTFDVGEPVDFRMAFKNISTSAFSDSLKVKVAVIDRNNIQRLIPVQKHKPLQANDTVTIRFNIDTKQLVGTNTLFVDVNPDNAQPEQYRFNNFAFRNFYVRGDTLNPLMDVTFDNVHILNRDIVSAKPEIMIKIKDEAKWMLMDDTAVASVQVRFPDGSLRSYQYGTGDTLTFIPAAGAPNSDNTASIRFKPYFDQDGDYELIVTGKDMSNNTAGAMSYRVSFQVINKPMISNMLNYPNPFTTSTAFVFTLTGSEVPQNLKIQVLTVTGKIVREITKQELGPIHIGRNITEFKWDGTDQYGQKLANGVYLYRVVTNLNGKSLDKYRDSMDDTDKYFNKGYGKMYLMR